MKTQSENNPLHSLVIAETVEKILNKDQKNFNRLVKKIEKLRQNIETTTNNLNKCLQFYSTHIHPKEIKSAELRAIISKKIFVFYKQKKLFSKSEKKMLKMFFTGQLNEIMPFMELDEELRVIFKEVHNMSFEDARQEDFQIIKDELQERFQEMGVEVNLDEFSMDMSEEEMMKKMKEFADSMQEKEKEFEAAQNTKKKTKKQLAKEELERQKEELKNTNISKIYRSLAKAFHPDLEHDEAKKIEKEVLMKRLTAAYESNDLHTLLSLEMEWIQGEEGNLEQLSSEKLRVYNEILKEQVAELEQQLHIIQEHPRYDPLNVYFARYHSRFNWKEDSLRIVAFNMQAINDEIADSLRLFEIEPMQEIRKIFATLEEQASEEDDLVAILEALRSGRI